MVKYFQITQKMTLTQNDSKNGFESINMNTTVTLLYGCFLLLYITFLSHGPQVIHLFFVDPEIL